MMERRDYLKATGAALGAGVLGAGGFSGVAGAESTWEYHLAGEALDAGVQEVVVQGDYAYTAQPASIATVDLSNPELPVLAGTALAEGTDNLDVKVDDDVAGVANDGDPGGVTFFDVSDPTTPTRTAFYEAASGIHNLYVQGDYAYLCVNDAFEYARMVVVDVSDPANPVSLEGDERGSDGAWMLRDAHPDMAKAGINPIHDVYVQDGLAYLCFWDAGVVVADVTDPTDVTAVAHFGAAEDAGVAPANTVEMYQRYLGGERTNAHYVRSSPDGSTTFVGAETFPGPYEDTVIPGEHGGIRVFDTSDVSTDSTPGDPYESEVGYIPAPEHPVAPADAATTAHNFDVTDSKLFSAFYQGGVRAYDVEDPTDPVELAAAAPTGTAYWAAVDLPTSGQDRYTVGSDIGKGLTVLRLDHETGQDATDDWTLEESLGPRDLLSNTMKKPL